MSGIYLSGLADAHANWLSVRQSVVASNIANANTPGFKAREVSPFQDGRSQFATLLATNASHLGGGVNNAAGYELSTDRPWDVYHSGGTVNLAREMMKSGDVATAFELNTTVMKSFHRMVVTAFGS